MLADFQRPALTWHVDVLLLLATYDFCLTEVVLVVSEPVAVCEKFAGFRQ